MGRIDVGTLLTVAGPVFAAFVTGFFLWVGTRGKTIADRDTAREQTATEAWQKLAEHTATQVAGLTSRIETLEATNRSLLDKQDAYRRHIHDWRGAYPDRDRWPEVPAIIRDDLGQ